MKNKHFILEKLILAFPLILFATILSCSHNPKKILAIGDSNGALEHGWVNQLRKLLPDDQIYNTSISGNTIGFDNLKREELNTLKNLNAYLTKAHDSLKSVDDVVIMLGTNDSKYVFKDRSEEVVANMNTLISRIRNFFNDLGQEPRIIIVAPPPYGDDAILAEKYKGGNERVKALAGEYEKLAHENHCEFVDVYHVLEGTFMNYSKDGVHLNEEGQTIIAENIAKKID